MFNFPPPYTGNLDFLFKPGYELVNIKTWEWRPAKCTISYNGNLHTSGVAPEDNSSYMVDSKAIVLGNTGSLVKTGYTFSHWNTYPNGSGNSYSPGDSLTIPDNHECLFAQWTPVSTSPPPPLKKV